MRHFVALYMRAWIEVTIAKIARNPMEVALYMRAWIEVNRR